MPVTGVLRVGAAFPDPPFEVGGNPPTGFDVELMRAIARELDVEYELHRYEGSDFDGIFAGLGDRYDVVASGATVTEHRRMLASWCDPYVRSGQSLVVNVRRSPGVHTTADLEGLVLGVQRGNTSEPVAQHLRADGKVGDVKLYAYDEIVRALDDVEAGTIDGFMKLEPVMRWLTAHRPALRIVQTGITTEFIALAVRRGNELLAAALNDAQRTLRERGELAALGARWFRDSDPDTTAIAG